MVSGELIDYYAYASNVSEDQMAARGMAFQSREIAFLEDYDLVFDKPSTVKYPGYAVANVHYRIGSRVEGSLYRGVPSEAMLNLDRDEGGYERRTLEVVGLDGSKRNAVVYVADPQLIQEGLPLSRKYLRRILSGGKDVFTPAYRQRIQNLLRG